MKKLLLSMLAVSLFAGGAQAQHCAAATNSVTPIPFAQPGLQPYSEDLPCTVIGIPVIDTIFFQNYTTVSGLPVGSLKIDSINNLPPGLCWTTNVANNTFNGGQSGVIVLSGTPTGPVGQYKLRIIVDVTVTGLGTLPNQDAEARTGLRYWVRTKCATTACTALDTASPYPSFIAYAACVGPPTAAINPSGAVGLCQGQSQTLTASSGTGYTYKWSTGATTSSISVNAAGSYVVTVYNSALDSAVSTPTVITVNTPPTVSVTPVGPDSICQGDSLRLTASGTGFSYLWSSGAAGQTITARNAGTYTVTATDANTCTAVSNGVIVVVKVPATPTIQRTGFTLSASTSTTYQWYKDGNILTGETSQTLAVTANGTYSVRTTSANGCGATSNPVSVLNVGITDITGQTVVALYPNPTEGALTLQTSGRTGESYVIHDAVGRMVQQQVISAERMTLDMSAQPAGIYTLTVLHGSAHETIRFTVIK